MASVQYAASRLAASATRVGGLSRMQHPALAAPVLHQSIAQERSLETVGTAVLLLWHRPTIREVCTWVGTSSNTHQIRLRQRKSVSDNGTGTVRFLKVSMRCARVFRWGYADLARRPAGVRRRSDRPHQTLSCAQGGKAPTAGLTAGGRKCHQIGITPTIKLIQTTGFLCMKRLECKEIGEPTRPCPRRSSLLQNQSLTHHRRP